MTENTRQNNIFFVCSLIEKIARDTHNTKKTITTKLGRNNIAKIYQLADVYHSDNLDKVSQDWIKKCHLVSGDYDILSHLDIAHPPTYWDMGRVYKRLVVDLSTDYHEYIDKLIEVLTSWLIPHLDDYNSSLYYQNPDYLQACYLSGQILP